MCLPSISVHSPWQTRSYTHVYHTLMHSCILTWAKKICWQVWVYQIHPVIAHGQTRHVRLFGIRVFAWLWKSVFTILQRVQIGKIDLTKTMKVTVCKSTLTLARRGYGVNLSEMSDPAQGIPSVESDGSSPAANVQWERRKALPPPPVPPKPWLKSPQESPGSHQRCTGPGKEVPYWSSFPCQNSPTAGKTLNHELDVEDPVKGAIATTPSNKQKPPELCQVIGHCLGFNHGSNDKPGKDCHTVAGTGSSECGAALPKAGQMISPSQLSWEEFSATTEITLKRFSSTSSVESDGSSPAANVQWERRKALSPPPVPPKPWLKSPQESPGSHQRCTGPGKEVYILLHTYWSSFPCQNSPTAGKTLNHKLDVEDPVKGAISATPSNKQEPPELCQVIGHCLGFNHGSNDKPGKDCHTVEGTGSSECGAASPKAGQMISPSLLCQCPPPKPQKLFTVLEAGVEMSNLSKVTSSTLGSIPCAPLGQEAARPGGGSTGGRVAPFPKPLRRKRPVALLHTEIQTPQAQSLDSGRRDGEACSLTTDVPVASVSLPKTKTSVEAVRRLEEPREVQNVEIRIESIQNRFEDLLDGATNQRPMLKMVDRLEDRKEHKRRTGGQREEVGGERQEGGEMALDVFDCNHGSTEDQSVYEDVNLSNPQATFPGNQTDVRRQEVTGSDGGPKPVTFLSRGEGSMSPRTLNIYETVEIVKPFLLADVSAVKFVGSALDFSVQKYRIGLSRKRKHRPPWKRRFRQDQSSLTLASTYLQVFPASVFYRIPATDGQMAVTSQDAGTGPKPLVKIKMALRPGRTKLK